MQSTHLGRPLVGRNSNRVSSIGDPPITMASYVGTQREVRISAGANLAGEGPGGVNDTARLAGFTPTQMDVLCALFKEKDN